jgi:hypothetical protein
MKKFVCRTCGSTFTSKKADKHREPKYCSKECYAESLKRYKVCQCCGELFANNANERFCSANCRIVSRRGVALSLEMRIKLSNARKASNKCKGENLYNWKGGKATEGERAKLAYHKRRSKLNHKLDDKFLKRLYKAQREQCFYCGEQLQSYKAIEHLTPVSRGGDNDSCNIVYACRSCNSQKKDMTLEEFAIKTHRIYLCDKYDLIMTMAL